MDVALHAMRFNYDVLHRIMELCERTEVSKLMQTCKLLHREGARPLLRNKPIDLGWENEIVSFMMFLSADQPRRLAIPFRLCFSGNQIHPDLAGLLWAFLADIGPKLHLLSLHFYNPEAFLSSNIDLPLAFARIATIDEIVVIDAGTLSRELLQHVIGGPVKRVHIEYLCDEDDPLLDENDDPDDRNPIILLTSVKHTLTSLSGLWFQTDDEAEAYDIVYPNMRYLELNTFETPNLAHYVPAFPNLASIALETGLSGPFPRDDGREASLRARNKTAQALHGRWPKLEWLTGSTVDLWCLGLDCPVEYVGLDSYPWDTPKFLDVLADTRPTHLYVELGGSVLCSLVTLPRAQDAIRAMRSLQLKVKFDKDDRELAGEDFQESLVKIVSSGQLTALWLSCSTFMMDFAHKREPSEPLYPIEQYLINADAEALADALQAGASSLQSITIEISDPRDGKVETFQRGSGYKYPERYSTETYSQFEIIRSDGSDLDMDLTEDDMEE